MSEVGFEPTPTFVDQKSLPHDEASIELESGALDRSAILTTKTIRIDSKLIING